MDIKINGKEFHGITRIEGEAVDDVAPVTYCRIWLWSGDEIVDTLTSPVTVEAI